MFVVLYQQYEATVVIITNFGHSRIHVHTHSWACMCMYVDASVYVRVCL